MDLVEAKLRQRLSEEEYALLELFLKTPTSKIRDIIVRLMEEAEEV
ncbi:MAG: hypothetical protein QXW32_03470 [Nitrososphaerales archaeon]